MQKVIIMLCSLYCCAYGMEQQSMLLGVDHVINNDALLDANTEMLENNTKEEVCDETCGNSNAQHYLDSNVELTQVFKDKENRNVGLSLMSDELQTENAMLQKDGSRLRKEYNEELSQVVEIYDQVTALKGMLDELSTKNAILKKERTQLRQKYNEDVDQLVDNSDIIETLEQGIAKLNTENAMFKKVKNRPENKKKTRKDQKLGHVQGNDVCYKEVDAADKVVAAKKDSLVTEDNEIGSFKWHDGEFELMSMVKTVCGKVFDMNDEMIKNMKRLIKEKAKVEEENIVLKAKLQDINDEFNGLLESCCEQLEYVGQLEENVQRQNEQIDKLQKMNKSLIELQTRQRMEKRSLHHNNDATLDCPGVPFPYKCVTFEEDVVGMQRMGQDRKDRDIADKSNT